jgi:copper transport protein
VTSARRSGRGAPMVARLAAVILIVAVLVVIGGRSATAHAQLTSTIPASGDQLETSPDEISLTFSEAIEQPEISLLDASGQPISVGPSIQPSSTTASATVPLLDDGGYVVAWRAISADGHPIEGAFTFAVGNGPLPDASVADVEGSPGGAWSVALTGARWVQYAGLALALGLWGFVVVCWWTGRDDRRVAFLVVLGASALAVGSAARIVAQAGYVDSSISDVLRTAAGRSWMTACVLALPIGLLATSLARLLRRSIHAVALAVLAILVGRAIAIGGHGATGRAPVLGNILTIVHVSAAALWLGGLVGVLLCLHRPHRTDAEPAVRRFSALVVGSVVLLAGTGTIQAIRRLETLDALTGSSYGRLLIVKVAVVAVLLAVAALSRFVLRSGELVMQSAGAEERRWPWQQVLGRTVVIELGLAVAVLGVTGALAGASPLVSSSSEPANLALIDGDRTAYISVFPARAGLNSIHITIDEPAIQGPDEITVQLVPADGRVGAIDVPVVDSGPGHVIAEAASIPFPGEWVIEVDARYGEFDLVTFVGEFTAG